MKKYPFEISCKSDYRMEIALKRAAVIIVFAISVFLTGNIAKCVSVKQTKRLFKSI